MFNDQVDLLKGIRLCRRPLQGLFFFAANVDPKPLTKNTRKKQSKNTFFLIAQILLIEVLAAAGASISKKRPSPKNVQKSLQNGSQHRSKIDAQSGPKATQTTTKKRQNAAQSEPQGSKNEAKILPKSMRGPPLAPKAPSKSPQDPPNHDCYRCLTIFRKMLLQFLVGCCLHF